MVQSPVKFDDLAFILLFFFMMVAVISFSQSNQTVGVEEQGDEEETITLVLSTSGSLFYNDQIVEDSFFSECKNIDLKLEQDVLWSTASLCINKMAELGVTVNIVV